jgi:glutamate/tyrosine decarboxylase-like PLP-dependent enzyme
MSTASRIEDIEQIAEDLHGRGTAVSVDAVAGGWIVRLWDKKGNLIEETDLGRKEDALRDMLRRLTS